VALVAVGSNMTWTAMVTFWPTYSLDNFGVDEGASGILIGLGSLTLIPSGLLSAAIVRRLGARTVMLVPNLVQVAVFAGLLATGSPWLNAALWSSIGLSMAYFPVMLSAPLHLKGARPDEVAVASSFLITVLDGSLALGPAITGAIADGTGSLGLALLLLSAAPLISVVGALLVPAALVEAEPIPEVPVLAPTATAP
jgi:cyanate permease